MMLHAFSVLGSSPIHPPSSCLTILGESCEARLFKVCVQASGWASLVFSPASLLIQSRIIKKPRPVKIPHMAKLGMNFTLWMKES